MLEFSKLSETALHLLNYKSKKDNECTSKTNKNLVPGLGIYHPWHTWAFSADTSRDTFFIDRSLLAFHHFAVGGVAA